MADAGDGLQQLNLVGKRAQLFLDPRRQFGDRGLELVDAFQVQAAQERMVFCEVADQRFGECGDLGAHAGLGHLGQGVGVAFPADERFEHGPAGDAEDVGRHRRQLDPGVFEFLFQPLGFPAQLMGQGGAVTGEVAQVPDRFRRHERCLQQPALAQLAQPCRIGDVGLAAGQALGVRGVHQDHGQAVLQQVERPAPVVAGRFHHHQGDLLGDQPIPQLQQRVRRGGEGPDLLAARAPAARARSAHAGLEVLLTDVQRGAPIVQHVHATLLDPDRHDRRAPSGGATGLKSLVRVLQQQLTVPASGPQRHTDSRAQGHHRLIGVPDGHPAHFPRLTAAAQRPGLLTRN